MVEEPLGFGFLGYFNIALFCGLFFIVREDSWKRQQWTDSFKNYARAGLL
jgi:hypothetical protein